MIKLIRLKLSIIRLKLSTIRLKLSTILFRKARYVLENGSGLDNFKKGLRIIKLAVFVSPNTKALQEFCDTLSEIMEDLVV